MKRASALAMCGIAAAVPNAVPTADLSASGHTLELMAKEIGEVFQRHGYDNAHTRAQMLIENAREGDISLGTMTAAPTISLKASDECKAARDVYKEDLTAALAARDKQAELKAELVTSHAEFTCECGINTDNCPSPPPTPPSPPSHPPPMGYLPLTADEAVEITSLHDSKVWDDGHGKIYMGSSHGGSNQKFFVEPVGTHIFKLHIASDPGRCVDLHTSENKIYIGDCHGGSNQQWYVEHGTMADSSSPAYLKSVHEGDGKCLDYNYGNNDLFMYDCHEGGNQQFYFLQ